MEVGKTKRIQVSTSALVDLKAALFRKQQDVKKEKSEIQIDSTDSLTRKVSDKTAAIWKNARKKAKGHTQRNQPNNKGSGETSNTEKELSQQEEDELRKSRQALEAKAALYERLSRGQGLREAEEGEDEEPRFMVDFTKKIYQDLQQTGMQTHHEQSGNGKETSTVENSPRAAPLHRSPGSSMTSGDSDEWVEYVDSFGRTRKCLQKDLPEIVGLDKNVQEKRECRSSSPQLLSEDMRCERERQTWEKQVELDKPVGPTHYQSVQEGEVRNHGVGYYQFSEEEEQRRKQMEMLEKLRKETHVQTEKKQKLQEKRKALLEARLAKVREKKLKQNKTDGEGIADFDFTKERVDNEKIDSPPKLESGDIRNLLDAELERAKEKSREEQNKVNEEKRASHFRPWDKGKVVDSIRKRKQQLEEERLPEFAPPTSYLDDMSEAKKIKTERNEQDLNHSNITQVTQPLNNCVTHPPPHQVTNVTQSSHVTLQQPPHYSHVIVPPIQWNTPNFVTPPPPPPMPYCYGGPSIAPTMAWNRPPYVTPPLPPGGQYVFPPPPLNQ